MMELTTAKRQSTRLSIKRPSINYQTSKSGFLSCWTYRLQSRCPTCTSCLGNSIKALKRLTTNTTKHPCISYLSPSLTASYWSTHLVVTYTQDWMQIHTTTKSNCHIESSIGLKPRFTRWGSLNTHYSTRCNNILNWNFQWKMHSV